MTTTVAVLLEYKAKTQGINNAFKQVSTSNRGLQKEVSKTDKAFTRMGSSIKGAFLGFATASAAFSAIRAVNTSVREFSKNIAELSAITGATGKDLEFLTKSAKEFGRTTLSSASQVAEAFKLVGSVKADLLSNLPALKAVTKQVITLSEASGVDLATAAKTVGSTLNQFGLEASEAARVVNVLAAGSKFGAAEVDDLGMALKFVGPIAANLGITIEETVAALELLAEAGITGSEAGTSLRAVLLRTSTQMNNDFNPTVVGLTKSLKNLKKENLSITESNKLFGRTAITAGLALVATSGKMDAMTRSVTSTNTAMEQATIVAGSYDAQIRKLGNSFEGLGISIGKSFEGNIFLRAIKTDVDNLTESIEKYGVVLGGIKGLTIDPIQTTLRGASRAITPSTGDAGASSTNTFESITGFEKSVIPAIGNELSNQIEESFIAPIISAGSEVQVFKESLSDANARLRNAFTGSFGDPARRIANQLIGEAGQREFESFKSAKDNIDPQFLKDTQQAASLVSQIKFASGNEKASLTNKLDKIQERLNRQAFSSKGFGASTTKFSNGGTFSVLGTGGGSQGREARIQQAIISDLNKFIAQGLNKPQQVEVNITVNEPDKAKWLTWFQKKTDQAINKKTSNAARQGAK